MFFVSQVKSKLKFTKFMEFEMETMQTTESGCGCQTNATSSVDKKNNGNQLDEQGACESSCSCTSSQDPKNVVLPSSFFVICGMPSK